VLSKEEERRDRSQATKWTEAPTNCAMLSRTPQTRETRPDTSE